MDRYVCPLECGQKIKSFYSHYNKCKRASLLGSEYLKCKYNYLHIIKREKYELHLENCESNKISENESGGFSDDSSECDDLIKITRKIEEKSKKQVKKRNSDKELLKEEIITKIFLYKNREECAIFSSEAEIDEDSKVFYEFVYGNVNCYHN